MTGEMLIYLAPVVILIGLLLLGMATLGRGENNDDQTPPAGSLLDRQELTLFNALREAAGEKFAVYPKVSLPTLITAQPPRDGRLPSEVDFVLCERETTQALLVVELLASKKPRLAAACEQIDLPLLLVRRAKSYDPQRLAEQVAELLENRPDGE